jgi:predicted ArsR family transcriptional regulator
MDSHLTPSRFWNTTRGRIVALLRRASRTVNELAEALDLTDNAVRVHIATLERDGLVEQVGTRRGAARKPNHAYDLTAEAAERLFPKAYAPVLQETLTVLRERLPAAEREALLREVGRRLAAPHAAGLDARSRQERLERTVALLTELGGQAEPGPALPDGRVPIEARNCPLSGVVDAGHPEVCAVAEALVASLMGEPAAERCDRGGATPRCRFLVGGVADTPEARPEDD